MCKLPVHLVKSLLLLVVFIFIYIIYAHEKIVFNTDISPDCNDEGTIVTSHTLTDLGEVEILALAISRGGNSAIWKLICLDVFTIYYNIPDIPVGTADSGLAFGYCYYQQISKEVTSDFDFNSVLNVIEPCV